jgi:predicted MFS family arabinose efflux permease
MVKGLVFDGNASDIIARLSSLVQAGFITGTLLFAILNVADRFRSSVLFFTCSLLAAFTNILILFFQDLSVVSVLRFATGFFLAGIYPVGMKIAAEKFPDKLGNALGFLVGALVLGTSLPHLLDGFGDWKMVAIITSLLAFLGGLLVLIFIPSELPKIKNIFNPRAIPVLFQSKNFKRAAFGYFGHMWELYAFWAFVPLIIEKFNQQQSPIDISKFSFLVIAIGGVGCVVGGLVSKKYGSKFIAMIALLVSLTCCLLIPFTLHYAFVFITLMVIWGFSVVADSPQFSTMVAQSAPAEYKGTALTIVTCIGFAITIVSIQLLKLVFENDIQMIWILVPGPVIGLWFTNKFKT